MSKRKAEASQDQQKRKRKVKPNVVVAQWKREMVPKITWRNRTFTIRTSPSQVYDAIQGLFVDPLVCMTIADYVGSTYGFGKNGLTKEELINDPKLSFLQPYFSFCESTVYHAQMDRTPIYQTPSDHDGGFTLSWQQACENKKSWKNTNDTLVLHVWNFVNARNVSEASIQLVLHVSEIPFFWLRDTEPIFIELNETQKQWMPRGIEFLEISFTRYVLEPEGTYTEFLPVLNYDGLVRFKAHRAALTKELKRLN